MRRRDVEAFAVTKVTAQTHAQGG